jgi:GNAT superfamily N-acetyltransferase
VQTWRFASPLRSDVASVEVPLDGGSALLRPLRSGEHDVLESVFDRLSPHARRDRYLVGMPRLPKAMRDVLAAVDGRDHVAWLATVADRPAGIGRYIRVGPGTAEVALEVVDAHQGRGLGAAILDTITTVAMISGVSRLQASVLASNHRSLHLLEKVGLRLADGATVLEGESDLRLMDPPRIDRAAVIRVAMGTAQPDGSWRTASATRH